MKSLIINADDFGYSKIFNESILNLIENNFISSTTVMVNWVNDNQKEQIKKVIELNQNYNLSIGLHLEFHDTNFKEEIQKQYNLFLKIFKFKPSHIDIHKPKKTSGGNLAVETFCRGNSFSCRNLDFNSKEIKTTNKVFNGTNLSFNDLDNLVKLINNDEIYEILFHPGTYDKNCKSSLNKQRELDVEKIKYLVSKLIKNNVELISFNDL